ncbi:MAG: hypothetical protein ACRDQ0_12260 [Pseudonocardia sp.]
MSRVKPANVRFYVDADVLGLARILVGIRSDVTFPGDLGGVVYKRERPPCVVTTPHTHDDVWIPQIAAQGLLIITRDRHIQTRLPEKAAVRANSARMVALASEDSVRVFDQLEVLMCRWRNIVDCLDKPGPFIYKATRTSFRAVPLT